MFEVTGNKPARRSFIPKKMSQAKASGNEKSANTLAPVW